MFAFVLFVHRVWVKGFVITFFPLETTSPPASTGRTRLVSNFNLGGTTHTANTSA
jgi:hypothetical protein